MKTPYTAEWYAAINSWSESPRDAIPSNGNDQSSKEQQAEDKKLMCRMVSSEFSAPTKTTMNGYEMSPGYRRVEQRARIASTRAAILNLGVRNRVRT